MRSLLFGNVGLNRCACVTNTNRAASGLASITQGQPSMCVLKTSPYLWSQREKTISIDDHACCIWLWELALRGSERWWMKPCDSWAEEEIWILRVELKSFSQVEPAHGTRWEWGLTIFCSFVLFLEEKEDKEEEKESSADQAATDLHGWIWICSLGFEREMLSLSACVELGGAEVGIETRN